MKRLLQFVSASLLVGMLASLVVIYGWGLHEYLRMMLQVTLTASLAGSLIGTFINRVEGRIEWRKHL